MARSPRKDRKPAADKMSARVGVKMTPLDRDSYKAQAEKAGFGSVAEYIRYLFASDRARVYPGDPPAAPPAAS